MKIISNKFYTVNGETVVFSSANSNTELWFDISFSLQFKETVHSYCKKNWLYLISKKEIRLSTEDEILLFYNNYNNLFLEIGFPKENFIKEKDFDFYQYIGKWCTHPCWVTKSVCLINKIEKRNNKNYSIYYKISYVNEFKYTEGCWEIPYDENIKDLRIITEDELESFKKNHQEKENPFSDNSNYNSFIFKPYDYYVAESKSSKILFKTTAFTVSEKCYSITTFNSSVSTYNILFSGILNPTDFVYRDATESEKLYLEACIHSNQLVYSKDSIIYTYLRLKKDSFFGKEGDLCKIIKDKDDSYVDVYNNFPKARISYNDFLKLFYIEHNNNPIETESLNYSYKDESIKENPDKVVIKEVIPIDTRLNNKKSNRKQLKFN